MAEKTVATDTTVNVEVRQPDGSSYVIPVDPSAILYDETGERPIGVKTPIAEKGSDFVRVEPIDVTRK